MGAVGARMSWYGEPDRHRLAAMGIPTARKKKHTPKAHEPAQKWARDILWRLDPDEVGEEYTTIDGRKYMLMYEGWGYTCFIDVEGYDSAKFAEDFTSHPGPGFYDDEELEERCQRHAYDVGNSLILKEWPEQVEPLGWNWVDGEHDEQKGQYGMTWGLWVRSPGEYWFRRPVVHK